MHRSIHRRSDQKLTWQVGIAVTVNLGGIVPNVDTAVASASRA